MDGFPETIAALSRDDWNLIVATASLLITIGAAGIAINTLVVSARHTSAATFVDISEAFSARWAAYADEEDASRAEFRLLEVMNIIELGCAIYIEKSITGKSRAMLSHFLRGALKKIEKIQGENFFLTYREDTTVFENIQKFKLLHPPSGHAPGA